MTTLLRRLCWPLIALFSCGAANAQDTASTPWLQEINKDIWIPFLKGVAENKESLYLDVHSTDYVRVDDKARLILDYVTYVDDTKTMMQRYAEGGTSIVMQVRFEERISNGGYASERGINKIVFTPRGSEPRIFYGRFHAISRKENGVWKILTDYFPPDPPPSDADFERAHAMDDLAPFRCYMPYPAKKLECGESSEAPTPRS